jgi:hypothetical protein
MMAQMILVRSFCFVDWAGKMPTPQEFQVTIPIPKHPVIKLINSQTQA